jgi:hypothetical protein
MVKKLNMKMGGKADLNSLDYEGFMKFIINYAYYIFSKPPRDFRFLGISAMMDEFFKTIISATKKMG